MAAKSQDAPASPVARIGGREVRLALTYGARWRVQSLPGGSPAGADFRNPQKIFSAAISWAWAMLPADARDEYPIPADLADAIVNETEAASLVTAVSAALVAGDVSAEKKSKS